MNLIKTVIVGISLALVLSALPGCRNPIARGGDFYPEVKADPAPQWTPEQKKKLDALYALHPDVMIIIKGHSDANAAAIEAYEGKRVDHNRKILRRYMPDEKVNVILPKAEVVEPPGKAP